MRALVTARLTRSKGRPRGHRPLGRICPCTVLARQRLVFRGLHVFLGCQSVPSRPPERLSMAQIVAELILYWL